MRETYDMTLFLGGALTGSRATQQRHLRQAHIMQSAIQNRWKRDNPWTWQTKHFLWFLNEHLKNHAIASRYSYRLTALFICKKLGLKDLSNLLNQAKP
ncbi:hypothetical protein [Pseudomonas monteilii]|uniref:hypothetical protein n=1 Tax=Pseudomonas monteilii TaxID=76759 RepID=UPI0018D69007|nr:hypothetical protein [Pseudomonas monteilii]MBH3393788.1 hypothetical protein [Pseudomonas monteilii]